MTRLTEMTEVGEQALIDGVRPVTLGEKLTAMTAHPMRPKRNPNAIQKSCDIGLLMVRRSKGSSGAFAAERASEIFFNFNSKQETNP